MRFEFEGVSYLIEFERSTRERPSHAQPKKLGEVAKKTQVLTTARILKVVGPKKEDVEVVRRYTVGHHYKDRLNYEAGRKYALALALYDAPTKGGGEPLVGTRLPKAFKTAVWNAYHGRVGGLFNPYVPPAPVAEPNEI
jgi:hypothetical protein